MTTMGLGGGQSEWDDYEWVRVADLPSERPVDPGLAARLTAEEVWDPGGGRRILLVDLDNLRSRPTVWRDRMSVMAALAREADDVVISGQHEAVARALPHLEEFGADAHGVAHGADLADLVLLAGASAVRARRVQTVVVSNDGIFAQLADRGMLTVISPGADALSDRLASAADRVIDLAVLSRPVEEPVG